MRWIALFTTSSLTTVMHTTIIVVPRVCAERGAELRRRGAQAEALAATAVRQAWIPATRSQKHRQHQRKIGGRPLRRAEQAADWGPRRRRSTSPSASRIIEQDTDVLICGFKRSGCRAAARDRKQRKGLRGDGAWLYGFILGRGLRQRCAMVHLWSSQRLAEFREGVATARTASLAASWP